MRNQTIVMITRQSGNDKVDETQPVAKQANINNMKTELLEPMRIGATRSGACTSP